MPVAARGDRFQSRIVVNPAVPVLLAHGAGAATPRIIPASSRRAPPSASLRIFCLCSFGCALGPTSYSCPTRAPHRRIADVLGNQIQTLCQRQIGAVAADHGPASCARLRWRSAERWPEASRRADLPRERARWFSAADCVRPAGAGRHAARCYCQGQRRRKRPPQVSRALRPRLPSSASIRWCSSPQGLGKATQRRAAFVEGGHQRSRRAPGLKAHTRGSNTSPCRRSRP